VGIKDFFSYLFATCPTFESASQVGMKMTLTTRWKDHRTGQWHEHEQSVTEPSKLKHLIMAAWPDKTVVRTTYKGKEIERASF
jgi:hypothetical protein